MKRVGSTGWSTRFAARDSRSHRHSRKRRRQKSEVRLVDSEAQLLRTATRVRRTSAAFRLYVRPFAAPRAPAADVNHLESLFQTSGGSPLGERPKIARMTHGLPQNCDGETTNATTARSPSFVAAVHSPATRTGGPLERNHRPAPRGGVRSFFAANRISDVAKK